MKKLNNIEQHEKDLENTEQPEKDLGKTVKQERKLYLADDDIPWHNNKTKVGKRKYTHI